MRIILLAATLIAITGHTAAQACRVAPSIQRYLEPLYDANRIESVAVATVTATASDKEAASDQDGNIREAFIRFRLKGDDVSGHIRFTPWGQKIEELRGSGGIIVSNCGIRRLANANVGEPIVIYFGRAQDREADVLFTLTLLDAVSADKRIQLLWKNRPANADTPEAKAN